MSEWNIKVEMNQNCCKHLVSRYYDGIEAETLEQAEEIAYHKFIDTLEDSITTREFITKPYWMDVTPRDYYEEINEVDKSLVKFKNSEKTGNVLCKNVNGLTLVSMWVKTDSFEFIDDDA